MRNFTLIVLISCITTFAFGKAPGAVSNLEFIQSTDSVVEQKPAKPIKAKSPKKAALLSLIPGGGQIYNGSYWKLPIVYGLGYLVVYNYQFNNTRFQFYKDLLILKDQDASDEAIISFVENYKTIEGTNDISSSYFVSITQSKVQSLHDGYREGVQSTFLYGLVWYGLNVLDAAVDAHFSTFDVSDDLTLNVRPAAQFVAAPSYGLSLSLNWR